jgi:hypothetical protein
LPGKTYGASIGGDTVSLVMAKPVSLIVEDFKKDIDGQNSTVYIEMNRRTVFPTSCYWKRNSILAHPRTIPKGKSSVFL